MEEDYFFQDNPIYMKSVVEKTATVVTLENKTYSGIVYVIDPISKTLVIESKEGQKHRLDLIMYHSIKSFETTSDVADPSYSLNGFVKEELSIEEHPQQVERRKKLMEWLKRNLIDVQEKGHLLVLPDQSVIIPPYGPEQCMCSNTIVLGRIRTIISSMPNEELN